MKVDIHQLLIQDKVDIKQIRTLQQDQQIGLRRYVRTGNSELARGGEVERMQSVLGGKRKMLISPESEEDDEQA